MYRLGEEVAKKILRNVKSPELGPMDITQLDPFQPKNLNSIGFVDCYAAIGTGFHYVLEIPFPYINPNLPPLETLYGYWLYHQNELMPPSESFSVPRYLTDPNIQDANEMMEVGDVSVVVAPDIDKLTCKSILTFEQLISNIPGILDCLNPDIK